ncbi:MAG: hypothetical protein J6D30_05105 [Clostridia bacterium]|nr:hypothetical protein [Clostridia bacterium]
MKVNFTKKLISAAAIVLACCTMGACANEAHVAFYPFWRENVSATQYKLNEELTYDVSFTPTEISSNRNYTLDYKDGVYKTSLTLNKSEDGQSFYYVYKTELTITACFTFNGETKSYQDQIVTETAFADDTTLKPTYSVKSIKSNSPTNASVSKIEECANPYEYEIRTEYNESCTQGTSIVTPKGEEARTTNFEIDSSKRNYLDNEQLLFALRGIDPTINPQSDLQVYAPFTRQMQTIGVRFSNIVGADFTFALNGASEKRTVQYYPVNIAITGKYPGATQTMWVASQKNAAFRNVILKLETPLSYDLGTLTYTLNSATFSNQ